MESFLLGNGMKSAAASRRQGLHPKEITNILIKACHAPSLKESVKESDFQPITPAPVWNEIATDLEIGNIDRSLWGWADSASIFFLEFWKSLDPSVTFILVYHKPEELFRKYDFHSSDRLSSKENSLLDNWVSYNAALLNFSLRYPGQTILLHSDLVALNPDYLIQELRPRLKLPEKTEASHGHTAYKSRQNSERALHPSQMNLSTISLSSDDPIPDLSKETLRSLYAAASHYKRGGSRDEQTSHHRLYQELQSAADLPLEECSSPEYVGLEWDSFVTEPLVLARSFCEIHGLFDSLSEKQRLNLSNSQLLTVQLQQVQEEMEKLFNENEKHKAENRKLKKEISKSQHKDAAKRVKQQLSYRLGATLVEQSRSIGGLLNLPFALYKEHRRFNNQKKRGKKTTSNPTKRREDDKAAKAVAQVKQQLSYRLGQTLVINARSPVGWLKLPFALMNETIKFKKKRRKPAKQREMKKNKSTTSKA